MRTATVALLICVSTIGLAVADDNPADVTVWSQLPSEEALG
jgi:hypothetical protein